MLDILFAVASASLLAVSAVTVYVAVRVLRGWERRQYSFPDPSDQQRERQEGDEHDEERRAEIDRQVLDIVSTARNSDRELLEIWKEQKRAEGWDERDIESFLNERPIFDLS